MISLKQYLINEGLLDVLSKDVKPEDFVKDFVKPFKEKIPVKITSTGGKDLTLSLGDRISVSYVNKDIIINASGVHKIDDYCKDFDDPKGHKEWLLKRIKTDANTQTEDGHHKTVGGWMMSIPYVKTEKNANGDEVSSIERYINYIGTPVNFDGKSRIDKDHIKQLYYKLYVAAAKPDSEKTYIPDDESYKEMRAMINPDLVALIKKVAGKK